MTDKEILELFAQTVIDSDRASDCIIKLARLVEERQRQRCCEAVAGLEGLSDEARVMAHAAILKAK